jgi:hypothetical protein
MLVLLGRWTLPGSDRRRSSRGRGLYWHGEPVIVRCLPTQAGDDVKPTFPLHQAEGEQAAQRVLTRGNRA